MKGNLRISSDLELCSRPEHFEEADGVDMPQKMSVFVVDVGIDGTNEGPRFFANRGSDALRWKSKNTTGSRAYQGRVSRQQIR